MRKLVTLRKVSEVRPIENSDFLELCVVDGWQCVTKKGAFKAGQVGVFFEVDSFLPAQPRYEFLRKSCFRKMFDGREGFRIKTMRLRGVLSQGLLMPPDELSFNIETITNEDLSESLGVIKWEVPINAALQTDAKGPFPSFIPKTDQERIQNLVEMLPNWQGKRFEISEKVDGASLTYYHNNGEFGLCSRNLELKESESNTAWKIAKEQGFVEKIKSMGNVAVQGEILGPGIQANPYKLKECQFFVFDIYDIDQHRYLNPKERHNMLALRMWHVPVLCPQEGDEMVYALEDLLKMSDGPSRINEEVMREGLVFKEMSESQDRVSFKVISNAFLLAEK